MHSPVWRLGAILVIAVAFGGMLAVAFPPAAPSEEQPLVSPESSSPGKAGGPYELHGYRSQFFELRRMEIGHRGDQGQSVFVAPAGWIHGLTDRDNLWIGAEDGSYRVQWVGGMAEPRGGIAATMKRQIGEFRDFARARGLIGRIRTSEEDGATIMEFMTPGVGDSEDMLVQNILLLRGEPYGVIVFAYHVHVRRDLWDSPEAKDIIQLFRAQALRAVMTREDLQDDLPPAGKDWRWNLRDLQAVRPYGFMHLRVPKAWREHHDPDMVGYFEPRRRSGEVWVAYDVMGTATPKGKANEVSSRSVKTLDRWHEVEGKPRLHLYWMVMDQTDDQLILVTVNLVLKEEQVNDPEFQDLTKILDHEIRRMRIGLAPNLSSSPERAKEAAEEARKK